MNTTPWRRSLAFYGAFAWRACLICPGLSVAFYMVAAPIEAAAQVSPLAATLFDLAVLPWLLVAGSCLALQWCSRARFGAFRLRVDPRRSNGLSFAEAARVTWAQVWRAALVAIPTYFVVRLLLVPLVLLWLAPATAKLQLLAGELVYLPFCAAIGWWAMREAIGLQYPGFRLRWIQEPIAASEAEGGLLADPR